ncbi:MAG: ectoine/hydroxyectoine ABC transporter substrate-binding protein EhuB [Thermoactinomyces sp.]
MKRIFALIFTILFTLTITACSATSANETTFEKAKREGAVTVGFANEKPYAYLTPDGQLTGEAVEVARAVLKRLGINQMHGVLTEFGSLYPGLQAKRFDMITAGMYITPPRCKQAAFANPEYHIGEALAVKSGNPLNLHSYKDIKENPHARIGVMGGAMEVDYLKKSGVSDKQIVIVPDQASAVSALEANRVDAITMTGPSLQSQLEGAGPGIERVKDFTQPVIDGKKRVITGPLLFAKKTAISRKLSTGNCKN